ncbi:MAG: hypothetical protein WCY98_11670 [Castellaniella sp.]
MLTSIVTVDARKIMDTRGMPTIEVDVGLACGSRGRAAISAAGATQPEQHANAGRRAQDDTLDTITMVNNQVTHAIAGLDVMNQQCLDERLQALARAHPCTPSRGNAYLSLSVAACRAAAAARNWPLHMHIAELAGTGRCEIPIPMISVLSARAHPDDHAATHELMIIPTGANSMAQAAHMSSLVRSAIATLCQQYGLTVLMTLDGRLSPSCHSTREALELLQHAIAIAGLVPGEDVHIAIDGDGTVLRDIADKSPQPPAPPVPTTAEITHTLNQWRAHFAIGTVVDALDASDWDGWQSLTQTLGSHLQLPGNRLFANQPDRLRQGAGLAVANAIVINANQKTTLTDIIDMVALAKQHQYASILSSVDGETGDTFMADLAVGTAAGQIRAGSLHTSNAARQYSQLLRIEASSDIAYATPPFPLRRPVAHP